MTIDEAIDQALDAALELLDRQSRDTARFEYFAPRRLGPSAGLTRAVWAVDYRVSGAVGHDDNPLRTLEDPGLLSQVDRLLNLGLRVSGLRF